MKITDAAKDDLILLMEENQVNGLRVVIEETCCGKSPAVGLDLLDPEEEKEEINGIQVVIPEEARNITDEMVIDKVNDELVILNTVCGCHGGCGSSCHGE